MAKRETPTNSTTRHENRVTTIYDAAASVFVRDGFAGATTRALSQASDVAESTLFRLVDDKASLYRSLFDYAWAEINGIIADAAFVADPAEPARTTDPAEILVRDLQTVARAFGDTRQRNLVTFAFQAVGRPPDWFDPALSPPYLRFRDRIRSHVQLVLQSRQGGQGEPAENADGLADSLVARLRGAWMAWYHMLEEVGDDERQPTLDDLVAHFRRLLRAGHANGDDTVDGSRTTRRAS
jgi:AcrR family transcriptional regulator